MKIIIDGDSCPRSALRKALNAAKERRSAVLVVSDRPLTDAIDDDARFLTVEHGSGTVDRIILEHGEPGDLLITRDLYLARAAMEKDLLVMNDRGRRWDRRTLRRRIEESEIMAAMREGRMVSKQNRSYGPEELAAFEQALRETLRGL